MKGCLFLTAKSKAIFKQLAASKAAGEDCGIMIDSFIIRNAKFKDGGFDDNLLFDERRNRGAKSRRYGVLIGDARRDVIYRLKGNPDADILLMSEKGALTHYLTFDENNGGWGFLPLI